MMTDCLHYKDYARDAIKSVVQKLEGGVVDGKRGEGPPVEMWPWAPSNLGTALSQGGLIRGWGMHETASVTRLKTFR